MQCEPAFCPVPCDPERRNRHTGDMAEICRQSEADFRLNLPADPQSVRSALRSAVARYRRRMTADEAGTMELVLAEVLNNIVEHAYENMSAGPIDLRIARDFRGLVCRIVDRGLPMPGGVLPLGAAPALVAAGNMGDLPEGGFGWFLIRDLTQNLSYVRDGATNRLDFVLPLSGG